MKLTDFNRFAREWVAEAKLLQVDEQLARVQCILQDLNSNVATPRESANEARRVRTEFDTAFAYSKELEAWIDTMDEELPPLKNFILPVRVLIFIYFLLSL
jgi:cob(I)alamin adenosyltransferase